MELIDEYLFYEKPFGSDKMNIHETVNIPIALSKSLQGKYFVGLSREEFGAGKYAWAALINPVNSRVNLHVNVFTVGNVTDIPFLFQVWFNPKLPGKPQLTDMVSPANTALFPQPKPKVQFMFASNVDELPQDGVLVFGRAVPPETTIVSEEDGKFIFPPGGSFAINYLPPETSSEKILGRVAFGWWEEKIEC